MKTMNKSGTAKDCLKDFLERHPKSKNLATFAEVNQDSEINWRLHGMSPQGETWLRVLYFLELCGYRVAELRAIPPELYLTGRCIVCNLIPIKTVLDKLKVNGAKRLYEYFRGDVGLSECRLQILRDIVLQHAAISPDLWAQKKKEFGIEGASPPVPESEAVPDADDSAITRFVAAAKIIRETGKVLLAGPVEQRKQLRRLMNSQQTPELHETYDVIHQLLKEKRKEI